MNTLAENSHFKPGDNLWASMLEGRETGRQEEDKVVQAPWQAYKVNTF